MFKLNKIRVLHVLSPFLRLLHTYHSDNFRNKNWSAILCSVFSALLATVIVLWLPLIIVLKFWHLIEVGANFARFAVSFPLVISLVQMQITCIVLIMKSSALNNAINRLQELVNQRKFLFNLLLA